MPRDQTVVEWRLHTTWEVYTAKISRPRFEAGEWASRIVPTPLSIYYWTGKNFCYLMKTRPNSSTSLPKSGWSLQKKARSQCLQMANMLCNPVLVKICICKNDVAWAKVCPGALKCTATTHTVGRTVFLYRHLRSRETSVGLRLLTPVNNTGLSPDSTDLNAFWDFTPVLIRALYWSDLASWSSNYLTEQYSNRVLSLLPLLER